LISDIQDLGIVPDQTERMLQSIAETGEPDQSSYSSY
jgi:hypothetical protein